MSRVLSRTATYLLVSACGLADACQSRGQEDSGLLGATNDARYGNITIARYGRRTPVLFPCSILRNRRRVIFTNTRVVRWGSPRRTPKKKSGSHDRPVVIVRLRWANRQVPGTILIPLSLQLGQPKALLWSVQVLRTVDSLLPLLGSIDLNTRSAGLRGVLRLGSIYHS